MPLFFLKQYLFFFALVLYGLFGSSTPDNVGWAELVTSLSLILSLNIPAFFSQTEDSNKPLFAMLVFGVSIPLLSGVLNANSLNLMMRDIIPFLFLLLPLFYGSLFRDQKSLNRLILFIVFCGIAFSLRAVFEAMNLPFWFGVNTQELFYFANAPTVLFAAIYLVLKSGQKLLSGHLLNSLLCLCLSLLPIIAMVLSMQRASLGLLALITMAGVIMIVIKSPRKSVPLIIALFALGTIFHPVITEIIHLLSQKTALVGVNMRFEELIAVWSAVSETPLHLLFGLGWGGTFFSPAVEGIEVNYTHSLLSAMLLKTGLSGFMLILGFGWLIAQKIKIVSQRNHILAISLAAPILIDFILYAAYKSFDFGVVILLIFVAAAHCKDKASAVRNRHGKKEKDPVHQPGLSTT